MNIKRSINSDSIDIFVNDKLTSEFKFFGEEIASGDQRNVTIHFGIESAIDSSGIGSLVSLHEKLKRRGGKLKLIVTKKILNIFEMANVSTFFDISERD
jgi:anti-anti-sigma regulatory factor